MNRDISVSDPTLEAPAVAAALGVDPATGLSSAQAARRLTEYGPNLLRTNKAAPDDFAGATITLTNPGTIGTIASVPRLMKVSTPGTGAVPKALAHRLNAVSSSSAASRTCCLVARAWRRSARRGGDRGRVT